MKEREPNGPSSQKEANVLDFAKALEVNELKIKVQHLEEDLAKCRAWAKAWKNSCLNLRATNTDSALKIMEGQEVLVRLLQTVEDFVQEQISVATSKGDTSLIIKDITKILEFTRAIGEIKSTITDNIETIAGSISKPKKPLDN